MESIMQPQHTYPTLGEAIEFIFSMLRVCPAAKICLRLKAARLVV